MKDLILFSVKLYLETLWQLDSVIAISICKYLDRSEGENTLGKYHHIYKVLDIASAN